MAKSCEEAIPFLLGLYEALLSDVATYDPLLAKGCEKDLLSLRKLVQSRGPTVLFEELPKACKHLDKCLDSGLYTRSGLPTTSGPSDRYKTPMLFGGLYLKIFHEDGTLHQEVDPYAVFLLRTLLCLGKKVRIESDEGTDHAVRAFIETDDAIPDPHQIWENDGPFSSDLWHEAVPWMDTSTTPCETEAIFQKWKEHAGIADLFVAREARRKGITSREVWRSLSYVSLNRLTEQWDSLARVMFHISRWIMAEIGHYNPYLHKCKHGPGAIAAVSGLGINKYEWYSWPERLETCFPIADFGYYSKSSWADLHPMVPEGEEPSRLCAVPKTFRKPRLIAAEPSSHAFCQQNILDFLRGRLCGKDAIARGELDFRDQTRNQTLALLGSEQRFIGGLDDRRRPCTMDLSEASDRISTQLVDLVFSFNRLLHWALIATRTRSVRVKTGPDRPEFVMRLKKFSTMGSAVTFPVQTILFWVLCKTAVVWASLNARRLPVTAQNIKNCMWTEPVSAYGDDLIVPVGAVGVAQELLEAFGLKINYDKTFTGGNFRESCGVDAFRSANVTPIYCRRADVSQPESLVSMTETANHLYQRWLLKSASYIRGVVAKHVCFPYVACDSGVLGNKTRIAPSVAPKYRWNSALQRCEVSITGIKTVSERASPEDDSRLFQYFVEDPEPHDEWEAGYLDRSRVKLTRRWVPATDLYGDWLSKDIREPREGYTE